MIRGQVYLAICALVAVIGKVDSIRCYRCDSTQIEEHPFQCDELFDDTDMEPEPCDDIHDARYCIKMIGRFEGAGIKCFQCSSILNISCSDLLIHDGGIEPRDCDHIFEAQYCIKMTGYAHGGRIGTKRNCSSVDLGNYCNYVQHAGDKLEYRSCYFTCTGDGCNPAPPAVKTSHVAAGVAAALATAFGRTARSF